LPNPGIKQEFSSLQVDSLPDELPRKPRGEGIVYPLQYSWASLVAQIVKNPPAMQETRLDPLEKIGKIP
ncbi:hypothetical protein ACVWOM_30205, partial [Pseudomonas aeruginosa]